MSLVRYFITVKEHRDGMRKTNLNCFIAWLIVVVLHSIFVILLFIVTIPFNCPRNLACPVSSIDPQQKTVNHNQIKKYLKCAVFEHTT